MTPIGCEQVDRAMDRELEDAGLPGGVRPHLQQCPRCRALYAWMVPPPSLAQVSPALATRITHSLLASLQPVKPLPASRVSMLQIAAIFGFFTMSLLVLMGTAGASHMTWPQILAMTVLLTTGVCFLSASLSWQMRPGSYHRVTITALLGIFGVGLLTGMALLFPWQSSPAFASQGWPCLVGGVGMAALAGLLLWLIARRGAPLSLTTMGVTLGATGGLLGVTVLQFKCPHQEASHLLVWHASVFPIAIGTGFLLGRLVEHFRRRA